MQLFFLHYYFLILHSVRVVIYKRITIHKVSQTDHGLRLFFFKNVQLYCCLIDLICRHRPDWNTLHRQSASLATMREKLRVHL